MDYNESLRAEILQLAIQVMDQAAEGDDLYEIIRDIDEYIRTGEI